MARKRSVSKTKFGIELENYPELDDWEDDGSGVYEIRTGPHTDFKDIIKFTSEQVAEHKSNRSFLLHSQRNGDTTSCSAHIHRSPVSFMVMDTLFKLTNIFQFFFKNSPHRNSEGNFMSYRQIKTTWCPLVRFRKDEYEDIYNTDRTYHALTVNQPNGQKTLEFRYMDFPKSLYQLSMFYYLSAITDKVIKSKNVKFEFDLIKMETTKDLDKVLSTNAFSYSNPNSLFLYDCNYKDVIMYFSKDIEILFSKWLFYDFYSGVYKTFGKLVRSGFNKELRAYTKYFDEWKSDTKWSNFWLETFNKPIPSKLIRSTAGDQSELS